MYSSVTTFSVPYKSRLYSSVNTFSALYVNTFSRLTYITMYPCCSEQYRKFEYSATLQQREQQRTVQTQLGKTTMSSTTTLNMHWEYLEQTTMYKQCHLLHYYSVGNCRELPQASHEQHNYSVINEGPELSVINEDLHTQLIIQQKQMCSGSI